MNEMNEEIKACPFCGSAMALHVFQAAEDEYGQPIGFSVACARTVNMQGGCGATGAYRKTRAGAITVWNSRAQTTPDDNGKTHWQGCHLEHGHSECAASVIAVLEAKLKERDQLIQDMSDEESTCRNLLAKWDQSDSHRIVPLSDVVEIALKEREATKIDRLQAALRYYAEGHHFVRSDESAWDTVSGEPHNFFCDEAGTATVENGAIARMAIEGMGFECGEEDDPIIIAPSNKESHELEEVSAAAIYEVARFINVPAEVVSRFIGLMKIACVALYKEKDSK